MNTADWVALGIIALCLICAIVYIVKHRGNSCGGSCGSCPYGGSCNKKDNGHDTKD